MQMRPTPMAYRDLADPSVNVDLKSKAKRIRLRSTQNPHSAVEESEDTL